MTPEIKEIEKKLEDCDKLKQDLLDELIEAHYAYFKSKGIEKGTKVVYDSPDSWNPSGLGIFHGIIVDFGHIKIFVHKLKKDGTEHATARLYCYDYSKLRKAKEDE